MLGNLLEPPASSITEYKISCPKCCNEIKTFVMPVKRSVLSVFLSDTFINNLLGQIIPKILVQTLYVYPEVGKVVYNQPRSNKAPVLIFLSVTVLQLIASELIRSDFDDENKFYCRLNVTDLRPAYLDDLIRGLISMVDESG